MASVGCSGEDVDGDVGDAAGSAKAAAASADVDASGDSGGKSTTLVLAKGMVSMRVYCPRT